jgi:hypothetical protein
MELSGRRWIASCAACEIVIGFVEEGRFVHDPECSQPLAIGRGTMRCCRCGGTLAVVEEPSDPLDTAEPEEPPSIQHLAHELSALRAREARQRG